MMEKLGKLYTLGVWLVKPGYEQTFIDAWRTFATWTWKNQPGATQGTLLQDVQDTQRFISFGPWKDKESIDAWRGRPEFQEFIKKAKDLCVDIQPHILKSVVKIN